MTDLLTRPLLRRHEPTAGSRAPWLAATVATIWALGASLALLGVPALVVWFAEGAAVPLAEPLRVGGQTWLVAHRAGLDLEAGRLTLAPLGLTIPALLLLHRAGRWAGHAAAVSDLRSSVVVAGTAAGVYGLGGLAVAVTAVTPAAAAAPLEAAAICAGIGGLAVGAGVLQGTGLVRPAVRRLPRWFVPGLVGGAGAGVLLVAGGTILVTISLLVHADRVAGLTRTLDAGVLGGFVVTLIGAALLPNAVVWAVAFALGPGFAVGAGTLVSSGGVRLGAVPALPALAALPVEMSRPAALATLIVPLAAGIGGGWLVHRRAGATRAYRLVFHGLGAGLVAGVGIGIAALLSGGSVGVNRLSVVGPLAWQVTWSAAIEVGLTAALVALLLRWHARGLPLRFWREDSQGMTDRDPPPSPEMAEVPASPASARRPIRVKDGRRVNKVRRR